MNILTPYSKEVDIKKLKESGADELYFGFYDDEWTDRFGEFSYINRMSDFKSRANAVPFKHTADLISQIKETGLKAYITMNAAEYSKEQSIVLDEYLDHLSDNSPDGIIVSSLASAIQVMSHGMKAVASTMCGIFNESILSRYIDAGVTRIILPRELTLSEIESMCSSHPEIEFEAFLMRNGCVFADSHCLGVHGRNHGALCQAFKNGPFKVDTLEKSFEKRQDYDWNMKVFDMMPRSNACAVCAIYRLIKCGVFAGKIVGRNDVPESVMRDIKLVRENIDIAKSSSSEEAYLEKMIFPSNRYSICIKGLGCYYPEVRFP
ncbi:MAG: U32 family peptidase [Lachnospiraceae bacterium]|nr:U32 family peptidase [Lachnospiraceae bacterium]